MRSHDSVIFFVFLERGALPLVGAAWGVTARKSSQNACNARGVTAGKMGRNSSSNNNYAGQECLTTLWYLYLVLSGLFSFGIH